MLTFGSFSSLYTLRERLALGAVTTDQDPNARIVQQRRSFQQHVQTLFHAKIPSVDRKKFFRRETIPSPKFTPFGRRPAVVQSNRIRKIDKLRFGHSFDPKTLEHALGDARDAGGVPVGERFERIQRPRKPTRFQHPEPESSVRLHILNMKDKGRAFDCSDEPSRDAKQQGRRNEHINVGARKR